MWSNITNIGLPSKPPEDISVHLDLLSFLDLDVGVTGMTGVTAMRIVGSMSLGNDIAEAASGNILTCHWGIAWVSSQLATAGDGSGLIPDPSENGAREALWIQRGVLSGITVASTLIPYAAAGQLTAFERLDIRQMRKQPMADAKLVLITRCFDTGGGASDPALWVDLQVLVALP